MKRQKREMERQRQRGALIHFDPGSVQGLKNKQWLKVTKLMPVFHA